MQFVYHVFISHRFHLRYIMLCAGQGRPLGGAPGALDPGADVEEAPKGGHRPATR
jgi:hypothetical protein